MDKLLDQFVRQRAGDRCEYCLIPQSEREFRFQIDHVIARQHRGATLPENLAL
jgi:HNH endonuclease